MRIGKYEFGLIEPFGWYGFKKDERCMAGCIIYTFGPFFFTILNLKCVEFTGADCDDCVVSVEPLNSPADIEMDNYLNSIKQVRREKKNKRKKVNKGKALGKRKRRK